MFWEFHNVPRMKILLPYELSDTLEPSVSHTKPDDVSERDQLAAACQHYFPYEQQIYHSKDCVDLFVEELTIVAGTQRVSPAWSRTISLRRCSSCQMAKMLNIM